MKMKRFLPIILVALLLVPVVGWATTYYVDYTNGDDNNTGTSESQAWKNLSKVSSSLFSAGDIIKFKCGETWTGQNITVGWSGTSDNYITFTSYGTGNKPVFDGNNSVGRGILLEGNDYLKIENICFKNYTSQAIGTHSGSSDHIIITNCEVDSCSYGFFLYGDYIEVSGCYIHDCPNTGIHITGLPSTGAHVHHNIVSNCGTTGNNTDGIFVGNNAGTFTIEDNVVIGQLGGAAIDSSNSTGANTQIAHVRRNVVLNPEATGISGGDEEVSDTFHFYYNKVVGGTNQIVAKGLGTYYIYNNTLINPSSNNFRSDNSYTRIVYFKNNICYSPTQYYLKLTSTNLTLVSDYNCFYDADSSTPYCWDSGLSFSGWKSTTGQDSHSFEQDPLFLSNYHLSPNSPCIDAGVKIAGIHDQADWKDLAGNMIHYGRAPDIGAYEAVTDVATAWGMLPWYGRKYCVRW